MEINNLREIRKEELHPILIDLAKVFHEICVKNNIRYWMVGGTQLGAIRHKGFIPWDDDMDFAVMYDDMDKLRDCLENELPSYYKCRDLHNCPFMYGYTLKIEDQRTITNTPIKAKKVEDKLGINIDIFPLNYTDNNKRIFSRNWLISLLLKCQFFKFGDYSKRGFTKHFTSIFLKVILFFVKFNAISNLVYNKLVINKGDYIVNYWGRWIMKEIVSKEIMGDPTLYPFENTHFYGVAKPAEYLTHLYGDYMKLPPENKRTLHLSDMYWRDSK